MAEDPKYATNQDRVNNVEYIDSVIESWTKQYPIKEVQRILDEASVPVSPIYSIKDIIEDVHYQSRDMIQEIVLDDGQKIKTPGIVPKLSETPGEIEANGPMLGQHNEEIYKEFLNFSYEDFKRLKEGGII